ncbi:MAG: DUF4430 domain-containing protein [Candidatus Komeilibacteria bacterium]|nr:DUF4430 domain-containing protein [Candidatus Komeilibacteria bacterium]
MKKLFVSLLIVATVTLGLPSNFKLEAAVGQATIDYLLRARQSSWITQGLAAAGQQNLNLDYLNGFEAQHANDAAKAVLAVVAAGHNPADYNGQNFVQTLLGFQNNNQLGAANLINDDKWGIMALRAAGLPADHAAIVNSKNYILQNQNQDGSWSYQPGSVSSSNNTAAAIMALAEAGLTRNDQVIVNALNYLRDFQNEDGGFSDNAGAVSDSASDAWMIAALNKLEIDPASWQRNNRNAIQHLISLMLNDGSFPYVAGEEQGNAVFTAQAAVALAGKSWPVARIVIGGNDDNGNNNELIDNDVANPNDGGLVNRPKHLRIEGANQTICDVEVEAATALQAVERGAGLCGYQYHITQSDFGPYLDRVNNEASEGANGWMYRVNWVSPQVGAADYDLRPGDYVLWAFGQFPLLPLRLSLSDDVVGLNEEVTAVVEYFDEQQWLPVVEARVQAGANVYTTNQNGRAILSFPERAAFDVYASKAGLIRSQKQPLTIGSGLTDALDLRVNIENANPGGGGNGGGNNGGRLAFEIAMDNLDFGTLRPSATASRAVRVSNTGDVDIYLEATVTGDTVFTQGLALDARIWEEYSANLPSQAGSEVSVSLTVPANYQSVGPKQGQLVFWAIAR